MTPPLRIENFTDPNCPVAYSSEPVRWRLRWLYGEALEWVPRMVVLSESVEEYAVKRIDPAKQAASYRRMQERFGMPFDTTPRAHMAVTIHACRAVVAARAHAPERAEALLRRLRIAQMGGGLLDAKETIPTAAAEAGLDASEVAAWTAEPEVEARLREDMHAARHPLPAALALDHRLADWPGGRRYTCPTYVLATNGGAPESVPGQNPLEAYEVTIANAAPELGRRADPEGVEEVLAWAGESLATAEVAMVCGLERADARTRLAGVAREERVGDDGFWSLA